MEPMISHIATFNAATAVIFLFSKIIIKGLVRLLANKAGPSGLLDGTVSLGIDLSIIGISIIIGGIATNRITLSTQESAIHLLCVVFSMILSILFYGIFYSDRINNYQKAAQLFAKIFSMTISWLCGFIPFAVGNLIIIK